MDNIYNKLKKKKYLILLGSALLYTVLCSILLILVDIFEIRSLRYEFRHIQGYIISIFIYLFILTSILILTFKKNLWLMLSARKNFQRYLHNGVKILSFLIGFLVGFECSRVIYHNNDLFLSAIFWFFYSFINLAAYSIYFDVNVIFRLKKQTHYLILLLIGLSSIFSIIGLLYFFIPTYLRLISIFFIFSIFSYFSLKLEVKIKEYLLLLVIENDNNMILIQNNEKKPLIESSISRKKRIRHFHDYVSNIYQKKIVKNQNRIQLFLKKGIQITFIIEICIFMLLVGYTLRNQAHGYSLIFSLFLTTLMQWVYLLSGIRSSTQMKGSFMLFCKIFSFNIGLWVFIVLFLTSFPTYMINVSLSLLFGLFLIPFIVKGEFLREKNYLEILKKKEWNKTNYENLDKLKVWFLKNRNFVHFFIGTSLFLIISTFLILYYAKDMFFLLLYIYVLVLAEINFIFFKKKIYFSVPLINNIKNALKSLLIFILLTMSLFLYQKSNIYENIAFFPTNTNFLRTMHILATTFIVAVILLIFLMFIMEIDQIRKRIKIKFGTYLASLFLCSIMITIGLYYIKQALFMEENFYFNISLMISWIISNGISFVRKWPILDIRTKSKRWNHTQKIFKIFTRILIFGFILNPIFVISIVHILNNLSKFGFFTLYSAIFWIGIGIYYKFNPLMLVFRILANIMKKISPIKYPKFEAYFNDNSKSIQALAYFALFCLIPLYLTFYIPSNFYDFLDIFEGINLFIFILNGIVIIFLEVKGILSELSWNVQKKDVEIHLKICSFCKNPIEENLFSSNQLNDPLKCEKCGHNIYVEELDDFDEEILRKQQQAIIEKIKIADTHQNK